MESAVAGTSTLNVADAISIGVKHVGQQWIPWATAMGAVLFLSLVPFIALIPLFGVLAAEDFFDVRVQEGTILGSAFAWIFVLLLCASAVAAMVLWLNSVRNAYRQCQGEVITIGSFFALRGLLIPFFTLLSVAVIVGVGLVMFVIPGLIVMVLLMYVPFAAAEPGSTIAEAFVRGWQAFVDNPGKSIGLWLLVAVVYCVANFTYFALLLVFPIIQLIMMVAYLMCVRRPIALGVIPAGT